MGDGGNGTEVGLDASEERFEAAVGGDFDTGVAEVGVFGCTADGDSSEPLPSSDLTRSSGSVAICVACTFFRLSEDGALAAPARFEEMLFRLNFCASILA